jgi:DNA-binding NarL/FixJ family response regulator
VTAYRNAAAPASAESSRPVFVLIAAESNPRRHADAALKAGLRVMSLTAREANAAHILDLSPSVVAVELSTANPGQTWEFIRALRSLPAGRRVPCIVYGEYLRPEDIKTAAQAGALWLYLESSDSTRLIAAARGIAVAARQERPI